MNQLVSIFQCKIMKVCQKNWGGQKKNDSERNIIQVNLINSGSRDLKGEMKDMGEEEKQIENPDEIVNLVENILVFNRQQQEQGLKNLTPNQMFSRLPISLAQLKAGNNFEKLKNEIAQLLFYLYISKKCL